MQVGASTKSDRGTVIAYESSAGKPHDPLTRILPYDTVQCSTVSIMRKEVASGISSDIHTSALEQNVAATPDELRAQIHNISQTGNEAPQLFEGML